MNSLQLHPVEAEEQVSADKLVIDKSIQDSQKRFVAALQNEKGRASGMLTGAGWTGETGQAFSSERSRRHIFSFA